MSSMLEQAIVDAKSLREAAIRNAEETLVEKYSDDIKEAVEKLLEQELPPEEEMMGMDPMAMPMGAPLEGPPEEGGELPEDPKATLAALDGEDLCPCPDDKEEVELDLSAIVDELQAMEAEEMGEPMPHEELGMALAEEIYIVDDETPRLFENKPPVDPSQMHRPAGTGFGGPESPARQGTTPAEFKAGFHADAYPEYYGTQGPRGGFQHVPRHVPPAYSPLGSEWPRWGEGGLPGEAVLAKDPGGPTFPGDPDYEQGGAKSQAQADAAVAHLGDLLRQGFGEEGIPVQTLTGDEAIQTLIPENEEFDISEEELKNLLEKVVVDMAPVTASWAGRPVAERQFEEDKHKAVLAQEHDIDVLQQENRKLEGHILKLQETVKVFKQRENKYNEVVGSLKQRFDEMSLANARLIYTNKVLNSDSLNERQKSRVVDAISNVNSVEEAKVIFEALQNAVGSRPAKRRGPKSLSEAVEKRSSSLLAGRRNRQPKSDVPDSAKSRMQRLAGIK